MRWLGRLGFERRGRGGRAHVPRSRRHARVDVVEEVARFRLEDVPFTLPTRRAMFGALTPIQQAAAPRREHAGRPRASARRTRPRCAGRRDAVEARRADLGRVDGAAHAAPTEPRRGGVGGTSSSGSRTSGSSRSRASTSPDGELPDEHVHVGGIFEGGFDRAKGVVETLYAALKAEPDFERTR